MTRVSAALRFEAALVCLGACGRSLPSSGASVAANRRRLPLLSLSAPWMGRALLIRSPKMSAVDMVLLRIVQPRAVVRGAVPDLAQRGGTNALRPPVSAGAGMQRHFMPAPFSGSSLPQ